MKLNEPAVTHCLQNEKQQAKCQTPQKAKVADLKKLNTLTIEMQCVTGINKLSTFHRKRNEND